MTFVDIVLVILLLIPLAMVITVLWHIWSPVPFIPTSGAAAKAMLELADLKPGQTVYDLGAGDGRLLIAAKKMCPDIKAVGLELVPTVWLLGKIRILLSRSTIEWFRKDALKQDVSDADCIFLYLMPGMMRALKERFDQQLKSGTRVIANTFMFPDKKPLKEVTVKMPLGRKRVFVYEW